jgi:hypothetical protein
MAPKPQAPQPRIGVVLVRWVDSSRITDWTFEEPDLGRRPHESVGFLSHRDDQAINVRPHRLIGPNGEEQHVGDLIIPLCAVLSIETLNRGI